jgi:uncharacterized protein (DUF1810 family)
MAGNFDLERFVSAQEPVYEQVLEELRAGRKRSHWMWFVFPQLAGLGRSATAIHFAIASRAEAQAYLDHPLLGARLRECTQAMLAVEGRSLSVILGFPDDLKFRSSMTLFAELAEPGPLFHSALAKYCDGKPDPKTLELLERL